MIIHAGFAPKKIGGCSPPLIALVVHPCPSVFIRGWLSVYSFAFLREMAPGSVVGQGADLALNPTAVFTTERTENAEKIVETSLGLRVHPCLSLGCSSAPLCVLCGENGFRRLATPPPTRYCSARG